MGITRILIFDHPNCHSTRWPKQYSCSNKILVVYPIIIPPFRVSQELAKATNDWVWCGAAIEGLASAKVLEPPPNGGGEATATTASGQAAGQLQRRGRSTGSVVGASGGIAAGPAGAGAASLGGPVAATVASGWPSWEILRSRGVEADVRELMAEARACYKKKGGVLAMQVCSSV